MILHKRISGSSLIEITTAVTLLSMVFLFSVLIYVKVSGASNSYNRLLLSSHIKHLENESVLNRNFVDEEISFDSYTIRKTVRYYNNNSNLIHLKIEGYLKSGKRICGNNKIIYEPK